LGVTTNRKEVKETSEHTNRNNKQQTTKKTSKEEDGEMKAFLFEKRLS
jgi:hypothetical protein